MQFRNLQIDPPLALLSIDIHACFKWGIGDKMLIKICIRLATSKQSELHPANLYPSLLGNFLFIKFSIHNVIASSQNAMRLLTKVQHKQNETCRLPTSFFCLQLSPSAINPCPINLVKHGLLPNFAQAIN